MSQWFVARDGKQQGPVSQDGLLQAIRRGKLRSSDMVWNESMPSWVTVADVPELAGALPQTAAAPVGVATAAAGAAAGNGEEYDVQPQAVQPERQEIAYQSSFRSGGQLLLTDRALEMLRLTRPWVLFISILMFIVVALGALVLVFGVIAAMMAMGSRGGGMAGGMMLLVNALQGAMLLLYAVPAFYLFRYSSRIAELLQQRREDLAEQALEAQKSFWKFVGILAVIWIVLIVLVFTLAIVAGVAAGGAF